MFHHHHRQRTQRTRNFRCPGCASFFSIQKELNYHVRHNCGRVHRCGICDTVYKSLQTAKVHFKRMHPGCREMKIVSEPMNAYKSEIEWDG